jgi:uncharacterized repeat protein (TIGR04076 family)
MRKLIIRVYEIKGDCPVYKMGDRIVMDEGYKLNTAKTENVCMHSLASIMPYYVALYRGVNPQELGLSKDPERAFVQCPDPCHLTGGGTVVLEIRTGKPDDD